MDDFLRNRTFDELQPGDAASIVRLVGHDDIDLFAAISGDQNPAHLDAAFAKTGLFGHVVAHGMWTASLVSALLGTRLPGPGAVYLSQTLTFLAPVRIGERNLDANAGRHFVRVQQGIDIVGLCHMRQYGSHRSST